MPMTLDPQTLALIGAATAAAGAGLVVWGATAAAQMRERRGPPQSLLAPTLAVDTLDPDLRVAYVRTLVLDARVQVRGGTTGTAALGRELRRALVGLQALRHRGHPDPQSVAVHTLIDDACGAAEADAPLDEHWDAWLEQARDLRRQIERG